MKYIIWILRIALGGLFIFSGIVKANDPLGLAYKMNEIFEVWGMHGMENFAFYSSVGMIAFEIISGVAIIVGNAYSTWISLMLLLNIFYTFLTWYIWSKGTVKECGCFGNCFKISNEATFEKDVALTAINLFLWFFRHRVFPIFQKPIVNIAVVGAAAVLSFAIQFYALAHLPFYDCLPYKKGNNLWETMHPDPATVIPDQYETLLVYEKNGVKKTFTTEEFNKEKVWEDKKWTFVEQKTKLIKEGNGKPEISPGDFVFNGMDDEDYTEDILTAKGYTFLWFVRNPEKAQNNIERIRNIISKAGAMKVNFYVLCSAGKDKAKTYQEVWNMKDVKFYNLDYTVSKTALRSDPGLMLLRDGVVVEKWSSADYPKDIVLDNGNLSYK